MAEAEDFGNWARNANGSAYGNCPQSYACFWSPTQGYSNRADQRDSYFPNNLTYSSGTNMNDNVDKVYNRMTSTNMRVYLHQNYSISIGACLAPGQVLTGLNSLNPQGVSSFKSC